MLAGESQVREFPADLIHVVLQNLTAIAQQRIYQLRDFSRTDFPFFVRGAPNCFHTGGMGIKATNRQQVLLVRFEQRRQGLPDFGILLLLFQAL